MLRQLRLASIDAWNGRASSSTTSHDAFVVCTCLILFFLRLVLLVVGFSFSVLLLLSSLASPPKNSKIGHLSLPLCSNSLNRWR